MKSPSTDGQSATDARAARDGDLRILASGARFALLGKVGGRGVHVVGQVVAARLLGVEAFGLYAIGWTILRVATKVGPLGLDHAAVRFGAGYWSEHRLALRSVIVRCVGAAFISGSILGAALLFGASTVATGLFGKPALTPVFEIFAFALPLAVLLRVTAAATRASQSVKPAVLSEDLGQPLTFLAFALPCLLLGGGLSGVLWSTTISFAFALLLAMALLWLLVSSLETDRGERSPALRKLLAFSIPASLSGTFVMLLIWADRLMIGAFLPAEDTGIYQAVSQSATLFAVVLGAFAAIFPPQIARLYRAGEHRRVEELYRVSTKWGLYLTTPLFLLIFFEAPNLLALIFGSEFVTGWVALIILTIGQVGNVATGGASQLLTMTGHQNRWLLTSALALGLNIMLNLLLIPRFGIEGAATASALSVAGLFLAAVVQAGTVLRMWPYDARYFKGLLAAGIAIAAIAAARGVIPEAPLARVAITVVLAATMFAGALAAFGIDHEERQVGRWLVRSLQRKSPR